MAMPLQQVKRMQKALNVRYVKGEPFVNRRYTKGVPFLQNKGKGLDLGAEPPRVKRFRAPSGQKASQELGNLPGCVANLIELFRESQCSERKKK